MICISLSGLSFPECITVIQQSEYAEIRIDLLDLSHDQFKELFNSKKNCIATCRSGKFTDDKKNSLLKMAIVAGARFVDIDYESLAPYREELTEFAHDHNAQVIISYHNFEKTPYPDFLDLVVNQSKKWKADRVKIATLAITKSDCSTIMALYARHENIIAFCMGELGKITRVAAPLLGAEFTYASWEDHRSTAPGQLTVAELNTIYKVLNINGSH